jgi:hypothetical protein
MPWRRIQPEYEFQADFSVSLSCASRVPFAWRRFRRVRSAPSARRRAEQARRGTGAARLHPRAGSSAFQQGLSLRTAHQGWGGSTLSLA